MMKGRLTQTRRLTRGYSLTEVAIVLGVVGVIMASIWAYLGTMNNKVKQQRFSEMLFTIIGNVRGNYAGKAYFETTRVDGNTGMMPRLTHMNVFSGEAVRVGAGGVSVVDSPFGKQPTTGLPSAGTAYDSLYVCGWQSAPSTTTAQCDFTTGTTNVPLFAVEVLLPRDACITAALRNSNAASLPGLVGVYINGAKQTLPLTLPAAVTGCGNTTNYVDFVFRLTP